ncbi:uncharacterized protein LY79DRAFT_663925 [Colletotrichum navitas]|uniref:Carrier domain-containing protein n=1 Tax=Colletotrichum navitas TaxID=681940 RepID=A0AAD8PJS2_9PEZI|nr:uncharacterized protein LY79DRAFT_663925 [Colletotrichum navitas]KAK1566047.1 hypothetical protein LY79DRAFT_663925 [Colletotrichum navitas]
MDSLPQKMHALGLSAPKDGSDKRDDKMHTLRRLWREALGLAPDADGTVSESTSFLDLGGDSIKAIKLVYTARKKGMSLKATDLLSGATLASLEAALQLRDAAGPGPRIPASTSYQGPVEQSLGQQGLWFLDQLNPDSQWYLLPVAMRLRGPLSEPALEAALMALERRHETLRTTFEDRDGVGLQVVNPPGMTKLEVMDVDDATLGKTLARHQTTPFNLGAQPAWRAGLLRLGQDHHVLSIVLHHIISDAWSINILLRELNQLYSKALEGQLDDSSPLPPLVLQYRDYATWQMQAAQQRKYQRQIEYWTVQLADSKPAELQADHLRPLMPSGCGATIDFSIDADTDEAVRAFAHSQQTTPFVILLAAFRAALFRVTAADDATVAVFTAGRPEAELEGLIGLFTNTVCVRTSVGGGRDSFEMLVRERVRPALMAAVENSDVPFGRVVSAVLPQAHKDTSRNPLAQIAIVLHDLDGPDTPELEGLRSEPLAEDVLGLRRSIGFDVEMHLRRGEGGRMRGVAVYARDLFEPETIQALVDVYQVVLRQGLKRPSEPIAELPLVAASSSAQVLGTGEPSAYPRDSNVVDVFRQQVAASPDAVAVCDSLSSLTYSRLDTDSDRLATWLRRRDMPPETPVAILSPRSCQAIVAILGVLKANLAYVPLDVNYPAGRIQTILSSMPGRKLLLLGPGVQPPELESTTDVEAVRIGDALTEQHGEPDLLRQGHGPTATSLAYIIFTSGSTGKPKSVMVEHRAILRLVVQSNVMAYLPPVPRVAHMANISFDVSVQEVWTALLNGGTVVCIDYLSMLDGKQLEAVIGRERASVAWMTPTLLKQCLAIAPGAISNLDVLFNVGDRFDPRDASKAKRLVRRAVLNTYGPTENGVHSTIYEVQSDDVFPNGVPIGRAISNTGVYVMDAHQRLVLPGVVGELVVTGDGLARGYHDPALDTDRFVHATVDGRRVRAYRTGDRGRCRPVDGQIEFMGRMDFQVKVRGHLVEPSEIEAAMVRAHEAVSTSAVVILQNDKLRDARLVGFVTLRKPADVDGGRQQQNGVVDTDDTEGMQVLIRKRLRHVLPTYMAPQSIIILDRMPLTPSGKVDRKRLAELASTAPIAPEATTRYMAPSNDAEAAVCQEFSDFFGLDKVGVAHNFFDLGGNSLLAMKLAARLRIRFHVLVPVKAVFDHPTPAAMAGHLPRVANNDNGDGAGAPAASDDYINFELCPGGEAFVESAIRPTLDAQYRNRVLDVYPAAQNVSWYIHGDVAGELLVSYVNLPASYDRNKLAEACVSLVHTIDSFSTVFVRAQGRIWHVVLDRPDVPVDNIDVDGQDEAFDAATSSIRESDQRNPPKLGGGALWTRVAILRNQQGQLRLVLRINHALWDGLSLPVMIETLQSLYEGVAVPPPTRHALFVKRKLDNQPECLKYWRRVLEGSSLTTMQNVRAMRKPGDDTGLLLRLVDVPPEARASASITQAAVFTTACALVLARETGQGDLLICSMTSGRQWLPPHMQRVVGLLIQSMPLRIRNVLDGAADLKALALQVQSQYLESAPYEAVEFNFIRDNAGVDWAPDADRFGVTVTFQNQGPSHESTTNGRSLQLSTQLTPTVIQRKSTVSGEMLSCMPILAGECSMDLGFMAIPQPDNRHYMVGIAADMSLCLNPEMDHIVDHVCDTFLYLNAALRDV